MKKLNLPIKQLIEEYIKGETCKNLSIQYQCSAQTIWRKLNENGISTKRDCLHTSKKFFYDRRFFEEINKMEKAYYLGWIFTDGHVDENGISLKIQKRDRIILENLICAIEGDVEQIKNYDYENANQVMLSLASKEMANDLKNSGIPFGNKTFSLTYPSISKKKEKHFVRGCFEGDGGFYRTKRKAPSVDIHFYGTRSMCEGICSFLNYDSKYVKPYCNIYQFRKVLSYFEDIKNFNNILYKECKNYFLPRKREILEKILEERRIWEGI
jgi:hypothetical protein